MKIQFHFVRTWSDGPMSNSGYERVPVDEVERISASTEPSKVIIHLKTGKTMTAKTPVILIDQ